MILILSNIDYLCFVWLGFDRWRYAQLLSEFLNVNYSVNQTSNGPNDTRL